MAFCGNCGTQLNDGVKFCPKCGHPTKNAGEVMKSVSNNTVNEPEEEQMETWQKVIAILFWPAGLVFAIVSFVKKKNAVANTALLYTAIGFAIAMILSAALGGCSSAVPGGSSNYEKALVDKSTLENEVKKIMTENARGQGHYITVYKLSLVHQGGNNYVGLADGTFDGRNMQWDVYAVCDGANVKAEWQPTTEYVQKENNRIIEEQQREYNRMMKEYQKQAEEQMRQIEFESQMQMRMNEWNEPY